MQNEVFVFTALSPVDLGKKKHLRWLYMTIFVASLIFLVAAVIRGNLFQIVMFSLFVLSNGIRLFLPENRKPVTLTINNAGYCLSNEQEDEKIDWKDTKMARLNGCYLDVYWGSSFRKRTDLQLFSPTDQSEILKLAGKYLAIHNVFIDENQQAGLVVS